MTPIDYLSKEEAIQVIATAKSAGVPDRDVVTDARQQGLDVTDGVADDDAAAEIWKAVDQGQVEAHIYGPGDRLLKTSPLETAQVPMLRTPRGGDFTFLRPSNSFYLKVVAEFGVNKLNMLELVFRKDQVEKLARFVRRRRRRSALSKAMKSTGRPSQLEAVSDCVRQTIDQDMWDVTKPLKALVQIVHRALKLDKGMSETTIARSLDALFESTRDRKFERRRRKAAGLKSNLVAVEVNGIDALAHNELQATTVFGQS